MKNLLATLVLLIATSISLMGQCFPAGPGTSGEIFCLFPDSARQCLYLGGGFHHSGSDTLNHCGYWNGSGYHPMGPMGQRGTNDSIWCFAMYNGDLYAGGNFTRAGRMNCGYIARWDGDQWHPVGRGFNRPVRSLCVYNGELYAGGEFNASGNDQMKNLARWDGHLWRQVGSGTNGPVNAMAVCYDQLFIAGDFTQVGDQDFNHICYWDGQSFQQAGTGISHWGMMGRNASINSMCVYQDELYCGGSFNRAGGYHMQNLAKWDGHQWHSVGDVGQGGSRVYAMCVYDDHLYVGGHFAYCGNWEANNLGIWDGSQWSNLGSGMDGVVRSLSVFNNELFIAGAFREATGTIVSNIARYSASTGIHKVDITPQLINTYPNPCSDMIRLGWNTESPGMASVVITDLSGKIYMDKDLGYRSSGTHEIQIPTTQLMDGAYHITILSGDQRHNGTILVTH